MLMMGMPHFLALSALLDRLLTSDATSKQHFFLVTDGTATSPMRAASRSSSARSFFCVDHRGAGEAYRRARFEFRHVVLPGGGGRYVSRRGNQPGLGSVHRPYITDVACKPLTALSNRLFVPIVQLDQFCVQFQAAVLPQDISLVSRVLCNSPLIV